MHEGEKDAMRKAALNCLGIFLVRAGVRGVYNPAQLLDWGKNSEPEAETETARVDSQRPPSDSLSVPAHSWYSLNANPPSDPGASIRGDGDGA